MRAVWDITIGACVLYLLTHTPGVAGDLFALATHAATHVIGYSRRDTPVSYPGELRIGPCNLSNDCID